VHVDRIGYYVRYIAIYLVFGASTAISSIESLTDPVPQWFSDRFDGTFVADVPGLEVAWRVVGGLEVAVAAVLVASLVLLEVLPRRRKPLLKLGLGLAALTSALLALGQGLGSQLDGAGSLLLYFGATMATLLIVIFDESTYNDPSGS
jgi:hypothetical protein